MSVKVSCQPGAVGKQLSDPCLHAWMFDISCLVCVMSGTLNGDDDT